MSLEVLDQLETKVQSAVENIALLKMEIDDLKKLNQTLQQDNEQLRSEQAAWQERLRVLLGKMEQFEEVV